MSDSGRAIAFDTDSTYEVHSMLRAEDINCGFIVLVGSNKELFFVDMRHVRVVDETPVLRILDSAA